MTDTTNNKCPACVERKKNWDGSPPICGFPEGTFDPENWNCASLNQLRQEISENMEPEACGDQSCVTVPFSDCGEFLVVTWYKNRGRTCGCIVVDGAKTRPARLGDIEDAIASLKASDPSEDETLRKVIDHIHETVAACGLGHPDPCDEDNCHAQVVVTEVHNTTMAAGWPE